MPKGYVDLKNIQEEDKYPEISDVESDYPYGLSLHLCDEVVTALAAGNLKPGDEVDLRGFALVTSTNTSEDMEDTDKSINLQLTSLSLSKKASDRVKSMYPEGEADVE